MIDETETRDGEHDEGASKPLDGLDHAINWLKRGGGLDQLQWGRVSARYHTNVAFALQEEKLEIIAQFRTAAAAFVGFYSSTIEAAYKNATAEFQSKSRKNTGPSEAEKFLSNFLSSLREIANGAPLLNVRTTEINNWTDTMTYFEILRQIPANASVAKTLSNIQGDWNKVHNQWLEARKAATQLE